MAYRYVATSVAGFIQQLAVNYVSRGYFAAEASQLRDIRVSPIYFMGYSVGCRQSCHNGCFHGRCSVGARWL